MTTRRIGLVLLLLAAAVATSVAFRREQPQDAAPPPDAPAHEHPAFARLRAFHYDPTGLETSTLREKTDVTVLTAYVHPEGGSRLTLEWMVEDGPDAYVHTFENLGRDLDVGLETIEDADAQLASHPARRILFRRGDGNHVLLVLERARRAGGYYAFAATCEDDPDGADLAVMERAIASFETGSFGDPTPGTFADPVFGVRIATAGLEGPVRGFPMRPVALASLRRATGHRGTLLVSAEHTAGSRASDLEALTARLGTEGSEVLGVWPQELDGREAAVIDTRVERKADSSRERRLFVWDGTVLWTALARWRSKWSEDDVKPLLDALASFRLTTPAR